MRDYIEWYTWFITVSKKISDLEKVLHQTNLDDKHNSLNVDLINNQSIYRSWLTPGKCLTYNNYIFFNPSVTDNNEVCMINNTDMLYITSLYSIRYYIHYSEKDKSSSFDKLFKKHFVLDDLDQDVDEPISDASKGEIAVYQKEPTSALSDMDRKSVLSGLFANLLSDVKDNSTNKQHKNKLNTQRQGESTYKSREYSYRQNADGTQHMKYKEKAVYQQGKDGPKHTYYKEKSSHQEHRDGPHYLQYKEGTTSEQGRNKHNYKPYDKFANKQNQNKPDYKPFQITFNNKPSQDNSDYASYVEKPTHKQDQSKSDYKPYDKFANKQNYGKPHYKPYDRFANKQNYGKSDYKPYVEKPVKQDQSKSDYASYVEKPVKQDQSKSDYASYVEKPTHKQDQSKSDDKPYVEKPVKQDQSKSDYKPYDKFANKQNYGKPHYKPYDKFANKQNYGKPHYKPYDKFANKQNYGKPHYKPYDKFANKQNYGKPHYKPYDKFANKQNYGKPHYKPYDKFANKQNYGKMNSRIYKKQHSNRFDKFGRRIRKPCTRRTNNLLQKWRMHLLQNKQDTYGKCMPKQANVTTFNKEFIIKLKRARKSYALFLRKRGISRINFITKLSRKYVPTEIGSLLIKKSLPHGGCRRRRKLYDRKAY